MGLKLLAVIWFHIAWLACVYCGLYGLTWASLLFPIVSFYILHRMDPLTANKIKRLFGLAFIGIVFDFVAIHFGWITFPKDEGLFPIWLLSMWLLFIAVLPLAEFIKNRLVIAAILGAIFGPLSYYSGNAFGVLYMNGSFAIVAYAVFWSLYFPMSLKIMKGTHL